ncbi:MAG: D-alanine--D-alanine ligase [Candidatus Raymondbacteria bacterium RifOxyA12_full_50_37]|uniref:D-alanine--D-alanine ligase n=1 Tax=Candidatus Raymondbacteria bacterium RIFOXYD12_FULL_49_13 TaxID=1817890 RepID=A0A1F7FHC0_UNCRA|nr:MAG: D-alanine--D-alanine ligase [Candidatus Raymondbacteria bacterium RifOxyA12_full_50_37]OGJ92434.1 MAG: D-alanine--D-alanine ligase [Candidatus Raymondbacteria bacterium RIFOXYA2_FULL_49_16]OGJ98855.1 MAG: D-alanine--D-alanine ligase [Candidatus Raymondbacteria bacterium RIFOXYC2_FULL_50_21]OGK03584.1 MAG: D-alanine--D-alanine ligase [Candidatus Raymondbacteria bacterium RifOxyB12_full_50_8]OGK05991.1 MAG: D-alanine--D-alanine ligase [Candidatus Raymondbacteria bacterium RIFOXYD12_FULL_4
MKEKTATSDKEPPPEPGIRSLGPVPNLEKHVKPEWWRTLFNATYLKTDGDVVGDREITAKEVHQFISILKLLQNDKILDLCCGQGRHSLELARRNFQNIEGLDRSNFLIQKAKSQAKKECLSVRFREGDARSLPFSADAFDAVMILGNSFGYFETVEDDLRILKEVFRALKPWGRLLIEVSDGDYLRKKFQPRSWEWIDSTYFVCRERSLSYDRQRLISREIVSNIEKGVVVDQFYAERLYNKESLRELLAEAGFSDIIFQGEMNGDSTRNQDLGMMARRIVVSSVVRKAWTPVKIRKGKPPRSVIVLMGDPTKTDIIKPAGVFDDDDIYTIDKLKGALREIELKGGYRFTYLNNHDTLIQDLQRFKDRGRVDFVFNLCDEGFDNDPRKELNVSALLDMLGIPYTGGGPQCLAYCYDKSLVRGIATEMAIPTPKAFFIKPDDIIFELAIEFPVIVKPNFGDSSFGITQRSVANTIEELMNAITEIREKLGYDKPILVEEFLVGKDLSVGIIGNTGKSPLILPITEEDYSDVPAELPRICGYEAKWMPDSPYWKIKSVPADLSDDTEKLIIDCCLKLQDRLECRDYTRYDWRLNANGKPKLLEVNPNPGWCWDGHLTKMAKFDNISYSGTIEAILQAAEQRIFPVQTEQRDNGEKAVQPVIAQEQ